MKQAYLLVLSVAVLLIASSQAAADVAQCSGLNNGETITASKTVCASTYNLASGITVGGTGVVLTCSPGVVIAGSGTGTGITVSGSNAEIRGCTIKNYGYDIEVRDVAGGGIILQNTVSNAGTGILILRSHYWIVEGNKVSSSATGVKFLNSNNGKLFNNSIGDSSEKGLSLVNSDNTELNGNAICNSGDKDISANDESSGISGSGNKCDKVSFGLSSCSFHCACADGTPAGSYATDGFYCSGLLEKVLRLDGGTCPYLVPVSTETEKYCKYSFCEGISAPAGAYTLSQVQMLDRMQDDNNAATGKVRRADILACANGDGCCRSTCNYSIDKDCLPRDLDGDGYKEDIDCNESNPNINPGKAEICDAGNVDENCDREVNRDTETNLVCNCTSGATLACNANKGICKAGTQTCAGGVWGACMYNGTAWENQRQDEICDGLDNDCDGLTESGDSDLGYLLDNGTFTVGAKPCGKQDGVCRGSTMACNGTNGWLPCTSGEYAKHNAAYQATETLSDGKDNDCNGKADDLILCPRRAHSCAASDKNSTRVDAACCCDSGYLPLASGLTSQQFQGTGKECKLAGCASDEDCTAPTAKHCDIATSTCVACANSSDCSGGSCKNGLCTTAEPITLTITSLETSSSSAYTLQLTSDVESACKYSMDSSESYGAMGTATALGTSHAFALIGLVEGDNEIYLACKDLAGNVVTANHTVSVTLTACTAETQETDCDDLNSCTIDSCRNSTCINDANASMKGKSCDAGKVCSTFGLCVECIDDSNCKTGEKCDVWACVKSDKDDAGGALCGNGVCDLERGEVAIRCPQDCHCGNRICEAGYAESSGNCPTDCKKSPLALIIILILVFVAGVGVYIAYAMGMFGKKTEGGEEKISFEGEPLEGESSPPPALAVKHNVNIPSNSTASIAGYVRSARAQGSSYAQIKKELLAKGWKEEQINKVFGEQA